jgi:hypothetical protein
MFAEVVSTRYYLEAVDAGCTVMEDNGVKQLFGAYSAELFACKSVTWQVVAVHMLRD